MERPVPLQVPLTPPLYGSFRAGPSTRPCGLRQDGPTLLNFAYNGWCSGTVAPQDAPFQRFNDLQPFIPPRIYPGIHLTNFTLVITFSTVSTHLWRVLISF